MIELEQRMANAHRRAARRNPLKRAEHLLAAALLDPPTPDHFGREILAAPRQTKRATRQSERAYKDKGITT